MEMNEIFEIPVELNHIFEVPVENYIEVEKRYIYEVPVEVNISEEKPKKVGKFEDQQHGLNNEIERLIEEIKLLKQNNDSLKRGTEKPKIFEIPIEMIPFEPTEDKQLE
jgi:hypothetical protein